MSQRVTKLRAVIDQQLAAAAHEIFRLLQGRPRGDVEQLKRLATERVTAAVHVIFTAFDEGRGVDGDREEEGGAEEPDGLRTPRDSYQQRLQEIAPGITCKGRRSQKEVDREGEQRAESPSRPSNQSPPGRRLISRGEKKKPKALSCTSCSRTFSRSSSLQRHTQAHHGGAPFTCPTCGLVFARSAQLARHTRCHPDSQDRTPSSPAALSLPEDTSSSSSQQHQDVPPPPPFICEFCGKTFMEKGVLRRHLRGHQGGAARSFSCEVCSKSFTMGQHLEVHRRIHTGEKPFTCRVCGKKFRQVGNLDSHMRIHTGEKPFVCSLCGKTFRQKVSLETHERFHKQEKNFGCQLCTKSFVQKIDLKRHMFTHTGEKPYSCSICGKSYQEKRSLDAHMKVHSGEKTTTPSSSGSVPGVSLLGTSEQQLQDRPQTDFIQL